MQIFIKKRTPINDRLCASVLMSSSTNNKLVNSISTETKQSNTMFSCIKGIWLNTTTNWWNLISEVLKFVVHTHIHFSFIKSNCKLRKKIRISGLQILRSSLHKSSIMFWISETIYQQINTPIQIGNELNRFHILVENIFLVRCKCFRAMK